MRLHVIRQQRDIASSSLSVMSTPPASSPFPPVRRIVTGHTPEGKAIVEEDSAVDFRASGSTTQFIDLFWNEKIPENNNGEFKDLAREHPNDLVNPNGGTLRTVDMPPGSISVSPHL